MIAFLITTVLLIGVSITAIASTPSGGTILHTVGLTSDNSDERTITDPGSGMPSMRIHYIFYKGNLFRRDSMNADMHGVGKGQELLLTAKIRTADEHVDGRTVSNIKDYNLNPGFSANGTYGYAPVAAAAHFQEKLFGTEFGYDSKNWDYVHW